MRFLDFLRVDAVKERRLLGEADVSGSPTQHFALTLELDPAYWPRPNSAFETRVPHLLRLAMAKLTLMDLEPYGRLPVEVWIDAEGRIRRVGWTTRRAQSDLSTVPWPTTELWDFGGPPPIADRESQPVIDPVTMEPVSQSLTSAATTNQAATASPEARSTASVTGRASCGHRKNSGLADLRRIERPPQAVSSSDPLQ